MNGSSVAGSEKFGHDLARALDLKALIPSHLRKSRNHFPAITVFTAYRDFDNHH